MNLHDLYSEYDLLKLSEEDYKELNKKNEFPNDVDRDDYLYKNLSIVMAEDESANIINSKALAGQVTVKWYKFDYTENFGKDDLIDKIENDVDGYNVPYNQIDINTRKNNIINIFKKDYIYIIRVLLEGKKRKKAFWETNPSDNAQEFVTVLINVSEQWIEIRAKNNFQKKVLMLLENKLNIKQYDQINILRKYDNDIYKFKNKLPNGFWFSYKANPTLNVEITEEHKVALVTIISALDNYYKSDNESERDEQILKVLHSIETGDEPFEFTNTVLAGLENFSLKIRDESDKGIEKQGLFSMIKDSVQPNIGYIQFSIVENGPKHTIRINTPSNSIYFMSSVTEDVIDYLRNMIL